MATTAAGFNTKSPTIKRILQEARELSRNPDPALTAQPLENDLFEWHFTIAGPPVSAYEAGMYHGRILLPAAYPLRPPMFRFTTPSGRFETNREICLSISGHHEETWQPAWGIRTALCAIRAFMESDAAGQVGGLNVGDAARRRMARESRTWRCGACCDRSNEEILQDCRARWEANGGDSQPADARRNEVPEELRLAYKDELAEPRLTAEEKGKAVERSADADNTNKLPGKEREEEEARRRDGGSEPPSSLAPVLSPSPTALQTPLASTGASVSPMPTPTPTRTTPRAQATRPATQLMSRDDGVPAWIDKAILGVAVSLLFMVLRKIVA